MDSSPTTDHVTTGPHPVHWSVESAHVVGFSMGGLVAQALAVRHPRRVERLVLARPTL